MPSGPLTLTSGKTGLLQRRSIFIIKVFKVFLCIVSQGTVVHYLNERYVRRVDDFNFKNDTLKY